MGVPPFAKQLQTRIDLLSKNAEVLLAQQGGYTDYRFTKKINGFRVRESCQMGVCRILTFRDLIRYKYLIRFSSLPKLITLEGCFLSHQIHPNTRMHIRRNYNTLQKKKSRETWHDHPQIYWLRSCFGHLNVYEYGFRSTKLGCLNSNFGDSCYLFGNHHINPTRYDRSIRIHHMLE